MLGYMIKRFSRRRKRFYAKETAPPDFRRRYRLLRCALLFSAGAHSMARAFLHILCDADAQIRIDPVCPGQLLKQQVIRQDLNGQSALDLRLLGHGG